MSQSDKNDHSDYWEEIEGYFVEIETPLPEDFEIPKQSSPPIIHTTNWESIAKAYKKELEHLWDEILTFSEIKYHKCTGIERFEDRVDDLVDDSERIVRDIERFS